MTLILTLCAFAEETTDGTDALIDLLPCLLFWSLDGYYLGQERLYRRLHNWVRRGEHVDCENFDLTPPRSYSQTPELVPQTMLRNTIGSFYVTIATVTFFVWAISDDWVAKLTALSQIRG